MKDEIEAKEIISTIKNLNTEIDYHDRINDLELAYKILKLKEFYEKNRNKLKKIAFKSNKIYRLKDHVKSWQRKEYTKLYLHQRKMNEFINWAKRNHAGSDIDTFIKSYKEYLKEESRETTKINFFYNVNYVKVISEVINIENGLTQLCMPLDDNFKPYESDNLPINVSLRGEFRYRFFDYRMDDFTSKYGTKEYFFLDLDDIGECVIKTKNTLKKLKDENGGFVYVINLSLTDLYKIGVSNDVNKRLSQLKTSNPFDLLLINKYHLLDPYTVEKQLHATFKEKRSNGEWFKLTNDDIYVIDQIVNNNL
jgi:hypothetical protein